MLMCRLLFLIIGIKLKLIDQLQCCIPPVLDYSNIVQILLLLLRHGTVSMENSI
jgi:hypothetical protein